LGGKVSTGTSLKPSLKTQWVAIFTRSVSTSYHNILQVVWGTYPRKIPLQALSLKRRAWMPGDLTQTQEPNTRRFFRLSLEPVEILIGNAEDMVEGIRPKLDVKASTN
jgi:hypothetical protein